MAQIFASRGSKQYKPYNAPDDAPTYKYNIPGHNINTYGVKDTGGQEWYLTDGGNWRNTATKQMQSQMPTYQASTAPAPAAPAAPATPPPPVQTQPTAPPTFRPTWDFMRNEDKGMFSAPQVQPIARVMDQLPRDWQNSPAFEHAYKQGSSLLDKELAAKGLLGSNVDLEQRADLKQRVLADETQRLMQAGQQDAAAQNTAYQAQAQERQNLQQLLAQLSSTDFNAYQNNYNQDANREVDKDNQRMVAMQTALDYIKSLNPMQYGYKALESSADLDKQLGTILAGAAGGGGGGGGGGGRAPSNVSPTANMPSSVNTFNPTNYWLNAGSQILPNLINSFSGGSSNNNSNNNSGGGGSWLSNLWS